MAATDFIWSWFGNSLVKKGAVAFLAAIVGLAAAPAVAPVLMKLGIFVGTVDIVSADGAKEVATQITILHKAFAAGLSAFAFMGLEAIRVISAKHPKVPLPDMIKKVL